MREWLLERLGYMGGWLHGKVEGKCGKLQGWMVVWEGESGKGWFLERVVLEKGGSRKGWF